MKRIFFILLICISLLLSGCDFENKDNSTSSSSADKTPSLPDENTDENLRFLIETTSQNSISIAIPISDTFTDAQDLFIDNFVSEKIESICDKNFTLRSSETDLVESERLYTDYYIDITGKISHQSTDIISIIFEGMLNQKDAAHPIHLLFTLNFHPETLKTVSLSDRYILDETLYQAFAQQAKADIRAQAGGQLPEDFISEMICSKDSFLDGLATEDEFCYYYTENKVGFSYPVSFALGGHIEVELSYSLLQPITH